MQWDILFSSHQPCCSASPSHSLRPKPYRASLRFSYVAVVLRVSTDLRRSPPRLRRPLPAATPTESCNVQLDLAPSVGGPVSCSFTGTSMSADGACHSADGVFEVGLQLFSN